MQQETKKSKPSVSKLSCQNYIAARQFIHGHVVDSCRELWLYMALSQNRLGPKTIVNIRFSSLWLFLKLRPPEYYFAFKLVCTQPPFHFYDNVHNGWLIKTDAI